MSPLTMSEVIKAIHGLPSLPAVVLDLLASLSQDEIDARDLARKIALDPALAVRVLRVANSSFYGLQRQIDSIGDAITVLGLRSVRDLATTAALADGLGRRDGTADLLPHWRHAIGTAVCARALAARLGMDPEQAYVAGLLHDIGCLVLATRFAAQFSAVLALRADSDCHRIEAEAAVLGLDHAMVGAALLGHWRLPEPVQLAVAHHHAPDAAGPRGLVPLLQLADATAHALDFSGDDDDLVPRVPAATWDALGVGEAMLLQVFRQAEREFEGACRVLVS